MSSIKVSVDRMVIEYRDVYWNFFNGFKQRVCEYYGITEYIGTQGFKYHLHIKETKEVYMHISFQPFHEPKSMKHTLRIETHPEHFVTFMSILGQLQRNASSIWFVRCDVAFEIPKPMSQVFTSSRTGRRMNRYEGTRYYGKSNQRQQHGYCRVYDKRVEQRERKGKHLEGELTRMEIVYAPKEKILMERLIQHPPEFNRLYQCTVLDDVEKIKPEKRAMVLAIQQEWMTLDEFTTYHRANIGKILESQQVIDFDLLAREQWKEIVTVPCALACGVVNRGG